MKTVVYKIDNERKNREIIAEAGRILQEGGLVAFPTETVYGLGANALNADASAKIYAAKGRPSDNPLIVHIADMKALDNIVSEFPEKARKLADFFWPGPLTMIFRKTDAVPYGTTGGLDTVAVRMPNHTIALELIRSGGGYIAAPSANTSGRPSPTLAEHVLEDMDGKVDMIIDGGAVGIGIESTIIDMSGEVPVILRPGFINQSMIEAQIGPVQMDKTISRQVDATERPKAPGMKYKHYAPRADLTIIEGDEAAVVRTINSYADQYEAKGIQVGIIATDETAGLYQRGVVMSIGRRSDEVSISQHLFQVLREFDHTGVGVIFSESFSGGEMGLAIMNRLLKAAGHKKIDV